MIRHLAVVQYWETNRYPDFVTGQNDLYTDMFSYTSAGSVAGKRFEATREVQGSNGQYAPATIDLDQSFTYDNEGRVTQMAYPPEFLSSAGGGSQAAGPVFNETYDTMGRANGMAGGTTSEVNSVAYNPSSQMTNVCFFGYCDGRTYNSMGQLVEISDPTVHYTYTYPVGANNGKIAQQHNVYTGETISYTYDALDRLTSATSSQNWGTAYVYDGFGNLLQKNVTAGSAPSLVQSVNTGTNQINYVSYDANGNQTVAAYLAGNATVAYDIQNREIQHAGWDHYAYNAANQRVWRLVNNNGTVTEEFYLYGVNGSRVATYTLQFNPPANGYAAYATAAVDDYSVYFAGRLIAHGEPYWYANGPSANGIQAVSTDQVGSVIDDKSLVFGGGDTYQQFYPWGEEKAGSSPNDRVKFATYRRDSESGIDYAWNRYYDNVTGRFLTPDAYKGSADPYNPQSWNRYTYVGDDPEGNDDPTGLEAGAFGNSIGPSAEDCIQDPTLCETDDWGDTGGGVSPTYPAPGSQTTLDYNAIYQAFESSGLGTVSLGPTAGTVDLTLPLGVYALYGNAFMPGMVGAGAGGGSVVLGTGIWEELAAAGPYVLIAGASLGLAYEIWQAMESRRLKKGDPIVVPRVGSAGRDSSGNCVRPPQYKWQAAASAHGSSSGTHWHWIEWDLADPTSCRWFSRRLSGPSDPGPDYILIPGVY